MAINPDYFDQKSRQIKTQASKILKKWGLLPRFKRWRLSKDPETGMIVLFGVLNKRYIARHTLIPFSNYFDSHLLHDLANKLQVQVVSGNSADMRYAFILSRGQIDMLPSKKDLTFLGEDRLYRVANSDEPVLEVIEQQKLSIIQLIRLRRKSG